MWFPIPFFTCIRSQRSLYGRVGSRTHAFFVPLLILLSIFRQPETIFALTIHSNITIA